MKEEIKTPQIDSCIDRAKGSIMEQYNPIAEEAKQELKNLKQKIEALSQQPPVENNTGMVIMYDRADLTPEQEAEIIEKFKHHNQIIINKPVEKPVAVAWPSEDKTEHEAKSYNNSMASIHEATWMPQGFKEGVKWTKENTTVIDMEEFLKWYVKNNITFAFGKFIFCTNKISNISNDFVHQRLTFPELIAKYNEYLKQQ